MSTLRKAYDLLSRRERLQALGLIIMTVFVAFVELLGVSSVLPFLSLMSDPAAVDNKPYLGTVRDMLGITSTQDFLIVVGLAAFALQLIAAIARAGGLWMTTHFTMMRRHALSLRLLRSYLYKPYEFYLSRHSGDLAKSVLSEIDQVMVSVYMPYSIIISQGMTLIAMLGLLIVINPMVAFIGGASLVGCYMVIYLAVRGVLNRSGDARVSSNKTRFTAVHESLAGIKSLRVLNREHESLTRYENPSLIYSRSLMLRAVLGRLPKFAIEGLVLGGIILLSLVLMIQAGVESNLMAELLPVLGVYALAGYRMLPAIHGVYEGISQLRFGAPALDRLYEDMTDEPDPEDQHRPAPTPMPLRNELVLDAIAYSYPGSDQRGLSDISLTVPAGTSLGIVGATGAGKTTLVDILLGLLPPQDGQITVDGTELTPDTVRNWQATIGYVPQDIFLMDDSIAANIALGLPHAQRDMDRIRDCARIARLDDLVMQTMTDGYETFIGDRGVRLSGGQRQRIGIARALYHAPSVLILDEATSALDNRTESEITQAINAMRGSHTILTIAHRLSTVRDCDRIVVLEAGKIVGLDTYDALMRDNAAFRRIALATEQGVEHAPPSVSEEDPSPHV